MVTVWDTTSYEKVREFSAHAELIVRLAFDADGHRLATASFDKYCESVGYKLLAKRFFLCLETQAMYGASHLALTVPTWRPRVEMIQHESYVPTIGRIGPPENASVCLSILD